jgi:hypothetical protein
MIDDVYALLTWLEDQSLECHNKKGKKGLTLIDDHGYFMQEQAYNRVIYYIKTMGKPTPPYKHENQAGENRW